MGMEAYRIPANTKEISAVREKVKWCLEQVKEKNMLSESLEAPSLGFDLKGTCGGRYFYNGRKIQVNIVFLRENYTDYIDETVPHEVGHYVVHMLERIKKGLAVRPHGPEWKYYVGLMDANPTWRHSYDESSAAIRLQPKHIYKCSCRYHVVGPRAFSQINKGTRRWCLKCMIDLSFIESIGRLTWEAANDRVAELPHISSLIL